MEIISTRTCMYNFDLKVMLYIYFLSAILSNNNYYIICVSPPSTALINFRSKLNSLNMPDRVNCLSFAGRRQAAKLIIRGGFETHCGLRPPPRHKRGPPAATDSPTDVPGRHPWSKMTDGRVRNGPQLKTRQSVLWTTEWGQLWKIHKLKDGRRGLISQTYYEK